MGQRPPADRHDRRRQRRLRREPAAAADPSAHLNLLGALAEALGRGTDVYLFLIGIMALAEFAQCDGLFAWIAVRAVRAAGASRMRLFALVYAVGIVTTTFLSNDATIVLLTPAVLHALERYDAEPLPYLVACALIANAASFVLPISNPANLLLFHDRLPPLGGWLARLALPALLAVAVTFGALVWRFAAQLRGRAERAEVADVDPPSALGVVVLLAAATAMVTTSAVAGPLGAVTFGCGAGAWLIAVVRRRSDGLAIVRGMSWSIVPLTALLFAIVAALDAAGALRVTGAALSWCAQRGPWSQLCGGGLVALASDVANNLPVALIGGETLARAPAAQPLATAAVVGVNLGPNLSATGSLATLLWLRIVRRNGIRIGARAFFAVGLLVAPPALVAALLALGR